MANICPKHGFSKPCPDCTDNSTTVQFDDLEYTNPTEMWDVDIPEVIRNKYERASDSADDWASFVDNLNPTENNVRKVFLWATMSIQTKTGHLDRFFEDLEFADFKSMKEELEKSADGTKKWQIYQDLYTTDYFKKVAEELQDRNYIEAQAIMCGFNDDQVRDEFYIRPTKANMVTHVFGDPDALCFDSRRLEVLDDFLEQAFDNRPRKGPEHDKPDMYELATHRTRQFNRRQADAVRPGSATFLQDHMNKSPEELRLITSEIMDFLDKRCPQVPRLAIHQILFNLGGQVSWHESLKEQVDN